MSTEDGRNAKLTKDSVSLLPCFYFVELPILASSVVSLYFLELTDVFKPVLAGYTCHDRSLSLPYVEPTHEVVPFLMLLSLAFAGPTATIMIGEGILYCCLSRRKDSAGAESDINAAGCNFNSYIRRAVRFVGVHVFGLCATALITDIIQLSTGYHAPYFLTVCKPNYTTLNTTCEENSFVVEDICSGSDPAVINGGRKSFPSQHATMASFAAVYISMYFNATLNDSSKLLKPALVFTFVICAIICGLTRIIQYKNHAVDVYLGFLIGGGIAVYLGLYAVGNFQPSEEPSNQQVQLRDPRQPLTDVRQDPGRHLQAKNTSSDGISSRSGSILNQSRRDAASLTNLKRASADVEVITPRIPMGKENMVTFSNTLPRVHSSAVEEAARRNATIHASMDATRSKQLLSQWKTKNESHNLSLQVIETEVTHSPQRAIEMRSSSEPAGVGINGDNHASASQFMKLTTSNNHLPSNGSGITGGTRVAMPLRPDSTKLVHIPEETQENISNTSPKTTTCRSKWLKVAEKSGMCRSNSQPRLMQVIAMSKQQGLLQGSPKSSDGSSVSCTGSIRYKALTDQESVSIVRVEAHPEGDHPSSANGNGSWKWSSQEKVAPRQPFELNDLNRDPERPESRVDGYDPINREMNNADCNSGNHCHHHPQAVTTIRVTPVEGGEVASETLSAASSQDSTLRRKGNIILIPERGSSPDNTRNIFYKGTSQSQAFGQ